ncbi:MAG: ATP-binding protein [Arcanobacterium sp.]
MADLVAAVIGNDAEAYKIAQTVREHLAPECEVVHAPTIESFPGSERLALLITYIDSTPGFIENVAYWSATNKYTYTRIMGLTFEREIANIGPLAALGKPDYLAYYPDLTEDQFKLNLDNQLRIFQEQSGRPVTRYSKYGGAFLVGNDMTETEMVEELVRHIDQVFGFQPRVRIAPGVTLTREGRPVEEIYFALSGRVSLHRRSAAGDIVMHHASTGRVIGLLALMRGSEGFLTATTTTEVLAIQLSFEQLNELVAVDPSVMPLLSALTMRSFERRLRRSEDLQVEKVELASELEIERKNLATALRNLEAARAELTAQARFASLGELAAGVAHELNNPMAAIKRTGDHLADDLEVLLGTSRDKRWAKQTLDTLHSALESSSITTKEARRLRGEFTKVTKDAELSQRLVLAGIRDPDIAKAVARSRKLSFDTVETAASIGTSLRNLQTASKRITELVASLRAYARPDGDPVTDINIHDTIEDTLRLINHKLNKIEVSRKFRNLPSIVGHPGELGQIWTNLLTNAAEALQETNPDAEVYGKIRIETSHPDQGWVEVRVIDNGPGIPIELQERIFEPRFTTKSGQVRFGMGIGLGVCRSIVQKHHGAMKIESDGQHGTTVVVRLPVDGPLSPMEVA